MAPRVLLIAEAANPEWVSVPLEGWSHSRAIASITRAHTATHLRNREAFLRAGVGPDEFTPIDSDRVARPMWKLSQLLRGGSGKGWTAVTALSAITYPYFEFQVWSQFKDRLKGGEFDLVHRLTPLSPTVPSPLASRCRALGIPFVLGPLNGGVPWPRWFDGARRAEREWLSYVRGAYRVLPWSGSTRRCASAIIAGSRDTLAQFTPRERERCVYIPENGLDLSRFPEESLEREPGPLRVVFVGRLVPYKGADMLLEAASDLVRAGRATITVVGDGPMMPELKALAERLGLGDGVAFAGWVKHTELRAHLARAHVFGFPSIREFGGAVVLEAMAMGAVPVIVDYGGPSELIGPSSGIAVPIGPRAQIVDGVRRALERLAGAPEALGPMADAARRRARSQFSWEHKARQVLEVYRWVLGERAQKPDFGLPLPEQAEADAEREVSGSARGGP